MARITVEDCLKKVESQYDLVLLAKERTSQLNSGAEMLVEADNDKNTVIALREIADGKVTIEELKNNSIARLRKEPDENLEEEEMEEVFDDSLKSNIRERFQKAVWRSFLLKRMRKNSNFTKQFLTEDKVSKEKEKPLELIEEAEEKNN